ncbi:hypothetical protein [Desulforhopalus singaporensis]|uniref:Uncharacterized protein n=1 Tax=Desulforhopalus singaporensis TaxID=91360 RepID=A0A1H0R031_9BACT|nr:hypothetical protein [Desulforhopalus singaporensis]SDP22871.1 hypothetical protein SAMN05660330_02155 [Desulforhopalus singaporensis]
MTKTKTIQYGVCLDLNIGSQGHFSILHRPTPDSDAYLVSVMSIGKQLKDIKLSLFYDDPEINQQIINNVEYFLLKLNPQSSLSHRIGYLKYFTTTTSNFMGQVIFGFVPCISHDNILYYFKARSLMKEIYTHYTFDQLQRFYIDEVGAILKDKVQGRSPLEPHEYNQRLLWLYDLTYDKIPNRDKFTIKPKDKPTLPEYAKWLSGLTIDNFNMLVKYMEDVVVINNVDTPMLYRLYYVNHQLHQG